MTRKLPAPLRYLFDLVRGPIEARIGPADFVLEHRDLSGKIPSIREGLDVLTANAGFLETSDDEPVFVLASAWRSGSTLLQRLVISDRRIVVWGEPYDHCDLIRRLAESVQAFEPDWPPPGFLMGERDRAQLSRQWVANLYPRLSDLAAAHREFHRRLFAAPAAEMGYARWGLKEVRLGIDHAHYLRWLFPKAKFVFLVRNPYNAYRSYRKIGGWYDRWPDRPMLTPKDFGRHWRSLSMGFLNGYQEVGGVLIRYEDLTSESFSVQDLAAYLGLDLDPGILKKRIAGMSNGAGQKGRKVPTGELRILEREIGREAETLGYARKR